jgi:hypothetical protein
MNGKRTLDVLLATLCAAVCSGWVGLNLALAGVEDSRFEFSPDGTSVEFDVRDTSRRDVLNQLFAGSDLEIVWINAAFGDERIRGKFTGTPAAVARQLLARTNFVIVHDASAEQSRVVRLVVVGPAQGEQSSAGLAALTAAIKPVSKPKEPEESEAVGGAPVRPEPARGLKPQLAGTAPMIGEGPKATPKGAAPVPTGAAPARGEGQRLPLTAAAARLGLVAAVSETGRGDDASGLLRPPPEDATAPLPILKGGNEAPPLVLPSQTLTAMPLTPAMAGTPAPALRPAPTGRGGN